jgi:hypothetical protein
VVLKLRQARLRCASDPVAVEVNQVFFRVSVNFASENWLLKRRRIKRREGQYAQRREITHLPVQHHCDTTAAIGSVLCQRLLLLLLHFLPHTKINSYPLKVARKRSAQPEAATT